MLRLLFSLLWSVLLWLLWGLLAFLQRPEWASWRWAALNSAWATLRALSSSLQTLLRRVASLRCARGDLVGSERAGEIAQALGNSVTQWTRAASVGWDYLIHYYFRQACSRPLDLSRTVHHLGDLLSDFGDLAQLRSDADRMYWISTNYMLVLSHAKALLKELLLEFDSSGALRDCLLAMRREVADGSLIRDALQLGASDLLGLVKMAMNLLRSMVARSAQNIHSEI